MKYTNRYLKKLQRFDQSTAKKTMDDYHHMYMDNF